MSCHWIRLTSKPPQGACKGRIGFNQSFLPWFDHQGHKEAPIVCLSQSKAQPLYELQAPVLNKTRAGLESMGQEKENDFLKKVRVVYGCNLCIYTYIIIG